MKIAQIILETTSPDKNSPEERGRQAGLTHPGSPIPADIENDPIARAAYKKGEEKGEEERSSGHYSESVKPAQQAAIAINKKQAHKKPKHVEEDSDPCWNNYKQVGMKKKDGKKVPNCVPKESVEEGHDRWAGRGFDLRSDILWPAHIVETKQPRKYNEFAGWLNNVRDQQAVPSKRSECILAMINLTLDSIIVSYGQAQYIGQTNTQYVLKIPSGVNKYDKKNQIVFDSKDSFDKFMTYLSLKFGGQDLSIDAHEMPVMENRTQSMAEGKTGPGLWANIHAKQNRIKAGSGEKMRKPDSKGAPKTSDFKASATESFNLEEEINKLEEKSAAWQRKEGKSKSGGLNKKGVASYRRANPGSKLQTAVTTKPSKLKAGSKDAKRRKSFCARMSDMKGPMKDEKGKPTRKALALKKWNCRSSTKEDINDSSKFKPQFMVYADDQLVDSFVNSKAARSFAIQSMHDDQAKHATWKIKNLEGQTVWVKRGKNESK